MANSVEVAICPGLCSFACEISHKKHSHSKLGVDSVRNRPSLPMRPRNSLSILASVSVSAFLLLSPIGLAVADDTPGPGQKTAQAEPAEAPAAPAEAEPAPAEQPQEAASFEADPAMVRLGEQIWKTKATCRSCHGALGNGVGDIPQEPQGANFRETALTPDLFKETIQCGRIGTAMPHFDPKAYVDDRCFGMTAADLGKDVPPSGGTLSPREMEAITQFVFATYVGKPAPTFEDCISFWGEGASTCTRYPKAAQ